MYCSFCGKQIAEDSVFCKYCGKPVTVAAPPVVTEWMYRDFIFQFPPDFGWVYRGPGGNSETEARSEFWQRSQQAIRLELQKWLDDGWEPIGEIGPAGISIEVLEREDYVEPTFFRSKMRIEKSQFLRSFVAGGHVVTDTAIVNITRPYHLWIGRAGAIHVIIDGRKMGLLRNGNTISREIMPGTHTIQLKAMGVSSKEKEFNIASSEQISFLMRIGTFGSTLEQTS